MPQRLHFVFLIVILTGCGNSKPPPHVTHTPKPSNPSAFQLVNAEQAGLRFQLGHRGKSPLNILETLGYGAGLCDFDGDGWLDVLLLGENKLALYRNKGNFTFEDVTAQSGLNTKGHWQGCCAGDYDNDGDADLFISGYRCAALYRNDGKGKFTDVTEAAGIRREFWSTSCAFGDVDNDGYLDLYVANYVKFFPTSVQLCKYVGLQIACGPTTYDPEKGILYHNNRNGTFTDETVKRGMGDAHGNALGVAFCDYDGDGWLDLAIANDQLPGDLYHNLGNGKFENVGVLTGTAYDPSGQAHAGMGIDWGDYDNDGRFDLVVTAYQNQPNSVYRQDHPGFFANTTYAVGIGLPTTPVLTFGTKFFDYDNDGFLDLIFANGHVVDNIEKATQGVTYFQKSQLFRNDKGKRFVDVSAQAGEAFQQPMVGRALCVGDVDNDGDLDALMTNAEGAPLLLRNNTPHLTSPPRGEESMNSPPLAGGAGGGGNWLALQLIGTKTNRDGAGAVVTLTANGTQQIRSAGRDGSFMSINDGRVFFGLGKATEIDRVTVRWLGGKMETLRNVKPNEYIVVREGQGIVKQRSNGVME